MYVAYETKNILKWIELGLAIYSLKTIKQHNNINKLKIYINILMLWWKCVVFIKFVPACKLVIYDKQIWGFWIPVGCYMYYLHHVGCSSKQAFKYWPHFF